MSAHVHAWALGVAPEYVCACGAVGLRRLRSTRDAAILVMARDAEEAAQRDRGDELRAEIVIAEQEDRWRNDGREPDETLAVDEYMACKDEEIRMGRKAPVIRHRWSPDDEGRLRGAVEIVYGGPDEERSPKVANWSAVAGRLLPDLVVTPSACRARWDVLLEREREEARQRAVARAQAEAEREEAAEARVVVEPDAWEQLDARIASWEAESADELTAALCGLRADVGDLDLRVRAWEGRLERIEAYVAALAAAWDVTP